MTAPTFFVPKVEAEHAEEEYTKLAARAGLRPLPHNERIYSIKYRSRGEDWTATVGDKLSGTRLKSLRRRGRTIERPVRLHDSATVLAIFPGPPTYLVVTDHRNPDPVGSAWENPLLAGIPSEVILFS